MTPEERLVKFLHDEMGVSAEHYMLTPVPFVLAQAIQPGATSEIIAGHTACLVRYDPYATELLMPHALLKFTGAQYVVTEAKQQGDRLAGYNKWVMVPIPPGHYFWMMVKGPIRLPDGHIHKEVIERRHLEKCFNFAGDKQ